MYVPFKGIISEAHISANVQSVLNNGRLEPCSIFELNTYECYEAYGLRNGKMMCAKFLEDLEECRSGNISHLRRKIMQAETAKKILKGQIQFKDRVLKTTPWDAFVSGTFYP